MRRKRMYVYQAVCVAVLLLLGACGDSGEDPVKASTEKASTSVKSKPQVQEIVTDASVRDYVAHNQAATFLREPVPVQLQEVPNEALLVWRQFREHRPVLVLISDEPLLLSIPESLRAPAQTMIAEGTDSELVARLARPTSDPLLGPSMTLRAALEADLFSRVVWVLPTKLGEPKEATPEQLQGFVQRLEKAGLITNEEKSRFALEGKSFVGNVQGVPLMVTSLHNLPKLNEPALLHIDVGYFSPLFKGGTKTPLYPLIWEVFNQLRSADWPILEATVSMSNISEKLPLASRFIGRDLVRLIEQPDMLNQEMLVTWQKRGQILYMQELFQKEGIRTIYQGMAEADPDDASVQYGLYLIHRQFDEPEKTLDYLHRAVELDSVYALEYLELAKVAQEQGLEEENLQMLKHASQALPENPFIKTELARALLRTNQPEMALELIHKLQELTWSTAFFPEMPQRLARGAEFAEKAKAVQGSAQ